MATRTLRPCRPELTAQSLPGRSRVVASVQSTGKPMCLNANPVAAAMTDGSSGPAEREAHAPDCCVRGCAAHSGSETGPLCHSRGTTAVSSSRGVAPVRSAQRGTSGAANGGGGPQAPPIRTTYKTRTCSSFRSPRAGVPSDPGPHGYHSPRFVARDEPPMRKARAEAGSVRLHHYGRSW